MTEQLLLAIANSTVLALISGPAGTAPLTQAGGATKSGCEHQVSCAVTWL
jgi:hypothetical protein